jgi:hypothetical protein
MSFAAAMDKTRRCPVMPSSLQVAGGYAVAAVLMLIAAAAEFRFGIDAEKRSLESITEPLSSVS